MTSVGLFEAKTHLSALARRVAAGEEIIVTDRGRPVMRLVPVEPKAANTVTPRQLLDRARAQLAQDGVTFTLDDILSLRDEGRR